MSSFSKPAPAPVAAPQPAPALNPVEEAELNFSSAPNIPSPLENQFSHMPPSQPAGVIQTSMVSEKPTYQQAIHVAEENAIKSSATSNMVVRTTAYCHKELDSLPYGKRNAVGTELKFGNNIRSAAADWSRFPVGTEFQIEGLPYNYVVDDYGSALVGTDTIDLYKPDFLTMKDWGARNVPINVTKWGCYETSRKILASRTHVGHANHVREMHAAITTKRKSRKVRTAPPVPVLPPMPDLTPKPREENLTVDPVIPESSLPNVIVMTSEDQSA